MTKTVLISALVGWILAAGLAAPVAAKAALTADDCRAEFQDNLIRQGGYAPEKLARSGAAGTAEYYYNRCLAAVEHGARVQSGRVGAGRVQTTRDKSVQPILYRGQCPRVLTQGTLYSCVRGFTNG